jgi:hypothetical protein
VYHRADARSLFRMYTNRLSATWGTLQGRAHRDSGQIVATPAFDSQIPIDQAEPRVEGTSKLRVDAATVTVAWLANRSSFVAGAPTFAPSALRWATSA